MNTVLNINNYPMGYLLMSIYFLGVFALKSDIKLFSVSFTGRFISSKIGNYPKNGSVSLILGLMDNLTDCPSS